MTVIEWDPRFIEIEYELWALSHLREVLEQQIIFLCEQDKVKTFGELKERGWEHDEAERRLDAPLALRDIRAESELHRFRTYFEAVLRIALDESRERLLLIDDLRLVRNAIAHANGQRRAMSDEQWKPVSAALVRRASPPDEYRGFIILSSGFIHLAYDAVNGSLRDLVARARSA